MLTTIRKILDAKGISVKDTIYHTTADPILDFQLTAGDYFSIREDINAREFEIFNTLRSLVDAKKKSTEYEAVDAQIQSIGDQLRALKEMDGDGDALAEKKSYLRSRKKEWSMKKASLEELYLAQSIEEIKRARVFNPKFLAYKDFLTCSSFNEIAAVIPRITEINSPKIRKMPLFVNGLNDLSQAVKNGEPIGIVGGPCLFGAHEVTIEISRTNGTTDQFDFSTGRQYDHFGLLPETDLETYFNLYSREIGHIRVTNFKRGVTYQEYLSMQYLFEFARVLEAKIVIPIPDMSYMKFFQAAAAPIEDRIKEPVFAEFENISYDIADMYLKVIGEFRLRYPEIECKVLHSRDNDLCSVFYERRRKYVRQLSRLRRVTAKEGKMDTIIDYITMLALPYYLYGIRNVLQVDSLDEADSMRKCMRIHSPDVNFFSILFPEYVCSDGIHTVFNAPTEFKDYITTGECLCNF